MNRRSLVLGGTLVTCVGAIALAQKAPPAKGGGRGPVASIFQVDPLWPKPMPNHWILGSAVGVAVDSHDHVFVVNLTDSFNARTESGSGTNPPTSECCTPAPNVLEYPYSRTVGAFTGRFMTGLRDGKIEGIKTAAGRVIVPPTEWDPEDGTQLTLDDFVEVGQAGVVTTWAWVHHPRAKHPIQHPFAWALVQLDGADTGMLHAVYAGDESARSTGMRVAVKWRAERVGEMQDIECFVPERAAS